MERKSIAMPPPLPSRRAAAVVPVAIAAMLLAGCGPQVARRYEISGRVTFRGQPVDAGNVSFDPVSGEANEAAPRGIGGGFAHVQGGRYDTSAGGRGHFGGLHRVTVIGSKPAAKPAGAKGGSSASDFTTLAALFAPYEVILDLPPRTSELDIDVPPP